LVEPETARKETPVKNTFSTISALTALALTTLALTGCPSVPSVPNTSVTTGNNAGNNTDNNTGNNTETAPAPDTTKPSIGNLEINSGKLSVTATDSSGIKKVEFYREALTKLAVKQEAPTPFFTDTSAPYEYEFDASENGQFNFYVKVFDQKDNVETSGKTAATVNVPDTKAPTKPVMTLNKTALLSGETLSATATNVSDNVGVTRVELLLVDTPEILLETDTSAPYRLEEVLNCNRVKKSALQQVAPEAPAPVAPVNNTQNRTVKVVAYDAAGNSSASDPQTVTVDCGSSE
jgi:hypothetical protein